MKKILFMLFIISVVVGYFLVQIIPNDQKTTIAVSPTPHITTTQRVPTPATEQKLLFVPYWTMGNKMLEIEGYDEVIYFGISPDESGIDIKEEGYTKLGTFIQRVDNTSKKLLTIRMIDTRINSLVLENRVLQQQIIKDSIAIAHQYGFSGIVSDFETSSLYFDSVVKQITEFNDSFYKQADDNDLDFYLTVYGDTFYRLRPYDISALEKSSDKILIMTYDFHKARGEPGPNFPLYGQEVYGYDFTRMVDDFLKKVPASKLGIIFGLYGYDWEINDKKQSIKSGMPLSYLKIKQDFIDNCHHKKCEYEKDTKSGETKVEYTDVQDKNHIVWFEDMESVEKKKKYALQKGISIFSYWAYSYF